MPNKITCEPAHAAQIPQARNRTDSSVDMEQRAAAIHWQQVSLRDAVIRGAGVFQERLFVDRRVDPSQRISLQISAATFDQLLNAVAAAQSLGTTRLSQLSYLGPKHAAEQLRTLAALRSDDVARLSTAERRSLESKRPLRWARLTEPRSLIASVAESRGWRLANLENIPHDLWPEGSFPELSAAEQLTVLLIGFDRTFKLQPSERVLEIVPLKPATIRREYRVPTGRLDLLDQVQRELPGRRISASPGRITVEGRLEDHERLMRLLRGRATPQRNQPADRQHVEVYTLRVEEQPVRTVLQQLAERLNWTVEYDEVGIRAAGRSADARVSFSVEQVDEQALLEAVLAPAGLAFVRKGTQIQIVPRANHR